MLNSIYGSRVLNSAKPGQNFWKKYVKVLKKNYLSNNLKIFHLAQKWRWRCNSLKFTPLNPTKPKYGHHRQTDIHKKRKPNDFSKLAACFARWQIILCDDCLSQDLLLCSSLD